MEISGLEEEYELSQALPHLLYVKEPAPERERRLTDLLTRMKQETPYRKLGSDRFDEVFTEGSRLNLRQALAEVQGKDQPHGE